ncbi:hypothetical protein N7519_011536 [Penicillium mononematosum]|uniref:uncharacterized protein n=1 Tax=Penicillium mononematosum TaxID=268346 RepID=UPI002547C04D|nr:uncharacterized protein N7519_011536 [Penicillium mononematosum]KAJ6181075.1 hypothetical protein N7519_011536 [Penicillium mononematosum]
MSVGFSTGKKFLTTSQRGPELPHQVGRTTCWASSTEEVQQKAEETATQLANYNYRVKQESFGKEYKEVFKLVDGVVIIIFQDSRFFRRCQPTCPACLISPPSVKKRRCARQPSNKFFDERPRVISQSFAPRSILQSLEIHGDEVFMHGYCSGNRIGVWVTNIEAEMEEGVLPPVDGHHP